MDSLAELKNPRPAVAAQASFEMHRVGGAFGAQHVRTRRDLYGGASACRYILEHLVHHAVHLYADQHGIPEEQALETVRDELIRVLCSPPTGSSEGSK